ncbi:hypothetical protein K501DRAFT_272951 [Backusella circina FSU 941]|nr:hypothetical protein K501DRAFT_272951 [Backusella circina FSU 941]
MIFRVQERQRFSLNSRLVSAIMLRRPAYPSRLVDLLLLFGLNYSTVCTAFNEMIEDLYDTFNTSIILSTEYFNLRNLSILSRANAEAASPFHNIVGFIDGALDLVCRPILY